MSGYQKSIQRVRDQGTAIRSPMKAASFLFFVILLGGRVEGDSWDDLFDDTDPEIGKYRFFSQPHDRPKKHPKQHSPFFSQSQSASFEMFSDSLVPSRGPPRKKRIKRRAQKSFTEGWSSLSLNMFWSEEDDQPRRRRKRGGATKDEHLHAMLRAQRDLNRQDDTIGRGSTVDERPWRRESKQNGSSSLIPVKSYLLSSFIITALSYFIIS